MPVQRAQLTQRSAALHTDFARSFVVRRFGELAATSLYENLPVFSRGPRKGLVKGYVHWSKVEVGGWLRDNSCLRGGRVVRPGTRDVCIRTNKDPASGHVLGEGQQRENESDEQFVKRIRRAVSQAFAGKISQSA